TPAIQDLRAPKPERSALITLPRGLTRIPPRGERLSGYKQALEEHGLPFREEYMRSVPREEIQQTLKELFQLPEPPTALLAGNDIVLAEALKYVNARRIRIPVELSIIGID
ncbi:substrate-binding domain-containing protein, partial [Bacillus cereus]|nr:substrate-binding domain-containing protein [Bacillus cereus]